MAERAQKSNVNPFVAEELFECLILDDVDYGSRRELSEIDKFKGLHPTRRPSEIVSIHIFIILSFIYPAANCSALGP